jgi:hypothetical protein
MIPGMGRYSMLITPRAGSLFHAVFQSTARRCEGLCHANQAILWSLFSNEYPNAVVAQIVPGIYQYATLS